MELKATEPNLIFWMIFNIALLFAIGYLLFKYFKKKSINQNNNI